MAITAFVPLFSISYIGIRSGQLVLFFMVSTTFKSAPGIQVDLPRSSQEVVIQEDEDLQVWITLEGAIYVDDQPVTLDSLTSVLTRTAERDPETLVVIKADAGVEHGRVVQVMDLARGRGLTRLAIATEVPEEE